MITDLWGFDFTTTFFILVGLCVALIFFIISSVVIDENNRKWLVAIVAFITSMVCIFYYVLWICSSVYMIVKIFQGDGNQIPMIDLILLVVSLLIMVSGGIFGGSRKSK